MLYYGTWDITNSIEPSKAWDPKALCTSEAETQYNLFFDFPFSNRVWNLTFEEIEHRMVLPRSWNGMFTSWSKKYARTFLNEPIL
jgi:hypothetical protein